MWIDLPKDIVIEKIQVERIPIPVPDPGGPVFKVLVNMGDQAKPSTVVTLTAQRRGDRPRHRRRRRQRRDHARGRHAADGLKVEFEQDGALPDEKASTPPSPRPPGRPTRR